MHNDMSGSARKETVCGRMDFGHGKIRMNVEGDRLSSLPDDLIHKILSFTSIKDVIGMSVLSSRWRFIWTSMPDLNFKECYTHSSSGFYKFVSNVLSRRNDQIQVSSLNLVFWRTISDEFVRRILNYAVSHNVQHLSVASSVSYFITTPTWDLPALTTLHLNGIMLPNDSSGKRIGFFSKCPNLENLSLRACKVRGTNDLNICHPRLSNLTLKDTLWFFEVVNVVAPKLKNFTIRGFSGEEHLKIFAPGLTSLVMNGLHPLQLFTENFPSLVKVDICINYPRLIDAHKIVCLLQQLHGVKFLTLNLEILEILSLSHQPSLLSNFKFIKFSTSDPVSVYLEVPAQTTEKIVTKSAGIKNRDSSSDANFTNFSCEEINVMRNIVSAHRLVVELRMLFECRKTFNDTNKVDHMERPNARMLSCKAQGIKQRTQSASEMQSYFGERNAKYKKMKIEELQTKLQSTKGLLTNLPASERHVIQATFSIVCEEADVITNNMLDSGKKHYNK